MPQNVNYSVETLSSSDRRRQGTESNSDRNRNEGNIRYMKNVKPRAPRAVEKQNIVPRIFIEAAKGKNHQRVKFSAEDKIDEKTSIERLKENSILRKFRERRPNEDIASRKFKDMFVDEDEIKQRKKFYQKFEKAERKKKQEDLKKRIEENWKKEKEARTPFKKFLNRMDFHQREKMKRLAKSRDIMGQMFKSEYSFHPKIDERSKLIANNVGKGVKLHSRFKEVIKEKEERIRKLRDVRDRRKQREDQRNLTFQPNAAKPPAPLTDKKLEEFLNRQKEYELNRVRKIGQEYIRKESNKTGFTQDVVISKNSKEIVKKMRKKKKKKLDGDMEDPGIRLYREAQKREEEKREKLRQIEKKLRPFKPKIRSTRRTRRKSSRSQSSTPGNFEVSTPRVVRNSLGNQGDMAKELFSQIETITHKKTSRRKESKDDNHGQENANFGMVSISDFKNETQRSNNSLERSPSFACEQGIDKLYQMCKSSQDPDLQYSSRKSFEETFADFENLTTFNANYDSRGDSRAGTNQFGKSNIFDGDDLMYVVDADDRELDFFKKYFKNY